MSNAMAVSPQDVIYQKALSVPERAILVKVVDDAALIVAGEILKDIKALQMEINMAFDPIIEKAHQAHKEAINQKKRIMAPLQDAENTLKPQIGIYHVEQEKKRREEEERQRLARQRAEEDIQIALAAEFEKAGEVEMARQLIETPVYTPPVQLASTTPVVPGISIRKTWDFEIVSEGIIPRQYLKIDEVAIRRVVIALGEKTNIPGIRAYQKAGVAVRNL